MTHIEWLDRITAGESLRQVSTRSHVPLATLSSQTRKGELRAETIIKIAEAYDESPVIALVDLGYMSARWITEPGVRTALSRASDEQLTDELLRRLRLLDDSTPADQLAEKRREKMSTPDVAASKYDGTVREWQDQPHAADNSTDEQKAREERGEDLVD